MPLQKLQYRPGVNREATNYSNEGGFYACDKVRFRSGYPEKLGGWQSISNPTLYTYSGVCRTMWNWIALDASNLNALGTSQKVYVEDGGEYHDVTPWAGIATTINANPFATVSGSKLVTVTDSSHGTVSGTWVTFAGATATGGILAATLNTAFEIITVTDGNTYTIISPTAATGTTSGGGSAVTARYQVNAGNSVYTVANGWGAGSWASFSTTSLTNPFTAAGTGISVLKVAHTAHGLVTGDYVYFSSIASLPCTVTIGGLTPAVNVFQKAFQITVTGANEYTISIIIGTDTYITNSTAASGGVVTVYIPAIPVRAWGGATTVGIGQQLRIWTLDNYGQDLVFAARGGAIYYWPKDTSTYVPAVTLASLANTATAVTSSSSAGVSFVSTNTNITVPYSIIPYLSPGSVIAGTGITAGTYITTAWDFSTTVPISIAATATASGAYTFSYSGQAVPTSTLQIFTSDAQRFAICFGANPYDPTNLSTTFDPMIVRWSDQENIYDWVPSSSNQAGEIRLSNGSTIVTGFHARQENLVFTDSSLFVMQYLGPPYVWKFNLIAENISLIGPNAVATANNVVYWMGVDKFYTYTGRVDTLPCTLQRYVFNNLNKDQAFQIVAGTNEGFNEVWWQYPSAGSVVNDSYVIYNYVENLWYYGGINRTAWQDSPLRQYPMAAFSVQPTYLNETLTAADTDISLVDTTSYPAEGSIQIDSEVITYTGNSGNTLTGCTRGALGTTAATHTQYTASPYYVPNQVMFHEVGTDDASRPVKIAIEAYVQSSDFDIGDGHNFGFVWRMIPDVTFNGSTVNTPTLFMTLKPRQASGAAYGEPSPTTVTSADNFVGSKVYPIEAYTQQVYTRLRGRQMSFKISSSTLGVNWQLGVPRIDIRPDGKR
jgi:hypothetical protein